MVKTIKITKTDYRNFTDYALKRLCTAATNNGTGFLKNMLIWCVLTVVFLFIFQVKLVSFKYFHWPSAVIIALPVSVVISAYFLNMWKIRSLCVPNEHGLMLGEKTLEFNADGIKEVHPLGYCFYYWHGVEAVAENNGDLYIFFDNLFALIIPRSAFSSDLESTEFQAMLTKFAEPK